MKITAIHNNGKAKIDKIIIPASLILYLFHFSICAHSITNAIDITTNATGGNNIERSKFLIRLIKLITLSFRLRTVKKITLETNIKTNNNIKNKNNDNLLLDSNKYSNDKISS